MPSPQASERSYVVERLDQLRLAIDTGRAGLLESLSKKEVQVEELDWSDLRQQAKSEVRDGEKGSREDIAAQTGTFGGAVCVFALWRFAGNARETGWAGSWDPAFARGSCGLLPRFSAGRVAGANGRAISNCRPMDGHGSNAAAEFGLA